MGKDGFANLFVKTVRGKPHWQEFWLERNVAESHASEIQGGEKNFVGERAKLGSLRGES